MSINVLYLTNKNKLAKNEITNFISNNANVGWHNQFLLIINYMARIMFTQSTTQPASVTVNLPWYSLE